MTDSVHSAFWIGRVDYLKVRTIAIAGFQSLNITANFYADGSVIFQQNHTVRFLGRLSSEPPEFSDATFEHQPSPEESATVERVLDTAKTRFAHGDTDWEICDGIRLGAANTSEVIHPLLVRFPPAMLSAARP
ncbi:MAG TPA: hypothetical protein QF564_26605 [Pirellulaceae bacterium]|nr:hypothetical protein [Pirellulaceae bacterium]